MAGLSPVTRLASLPLAVGMSLAIGCSGTSGPEAGVARIGAHGRIRVAVTAEGPGTTVEVGARFLGYRDLDAASAELLAGPLAVTAAATALSTGDCAVVDASGALDELLASADPGRPVVRELDAGDVAVTLDGAAVTATPSRLPALFPYVTGVQYGDQLLEIATTPHEGSEVTAAGFGGEHVGNFEVTAHLPMTPTVQSAIVGDQLHLTWSMAGRGDEPVVISVQRGFGEAQLVCRAVDDGELTVTAASLAAIPGWHAGDELMVSVERSVRQPFAAYGLGWAELEVAVRYVVSASAR
jgi:hypothetical protein